MPSDTHADAEAWQLREIALGLAELDSAKMVEHEQVVKWMRSWGKPSESAIRRLTAVSLYIAEDKSRQPRP